MEELKAQLQGNTFKTTNSFNSSVSMHSSSLLCVTAPLHPYHSTGELHTSPSKSSSSSNVSEPADKSAVEFKRSLKRTSTLECLQTNLSCDISSDSLEKRETLTSCSMTSFVGLSMGDDSVFGSVAGDRSPFMLHEISPPPENSSSSSDFEFIEAECKAQAEAEAEEQRSKTNSPIEDEFCFLTPIEEKSDESSRSSRVSEDRPLGKSFSLNSFRNVLVATSEDDHLKSQTFPRVSTPSPRRSVQLVTELYPLQPRELDPSCFYQLHSADSQEELQEFLLLESECMEDQARGIASAFTPPDSGEDESSKTQGNVISPN